MPISGLAMGPSEAMLAPMGSIPSSRLALGLIGQDDPFMGLIGQYGPLRGPIIGQDGPQMGPTGHADLQFSDGPQWPGRQSPHSRARPDPSSPCRACGMSPSVASPERKGSEQFRKSSFQAGSSDFQLPGMRAKTHMVCWTKLFVDDYNKGFWPKTWEI